MLHTGNGKKAPLTAPAMPWPSGGWHSPRQVGVTVCCCVHPAEPRCGSKMVVARFPGLASLHSANPGLGCGIPLGLVRKGIEEISRYHRFPHPRGDASAGVMSGRVANLNSADLPVVTGSRLPPNPFFCSIHITIPRVVVPYLPALCLPDLFTHYSVRPAAPPRPLAASCSGFSCLSLPLRSRKPKKPRKPFRSSQTSTPPDRRMQNVDRFLRPKMTGVPFAPSLM